MNHLKYKQFYDLLLINDSVEKNKKIIAYIKETLHTSFWDDDRHWFNKLCYDGLLEPIQYCKNSIEDFSLYDHSKSVKDLSNVSFLWAVESGNIDLVNLFINDAQFKHFKQRPKFDNDVARMFQYYRERNKNFSVDNYEKLMFLLSKKLPSAINNILDVAIMENKNDQLTDMVQNFINIYKTQITPELIKDNHDILTIYCIKSLKNNNPKLAIFIRDQFHSYDLDKYTFSSLLNYYDREIKHIDWLLAHPDFVKLDNTYFSSIFKDIFKNPLVNKIKKDDYEYFNHLVKLGLYEVKQEDFNYGIKNNLLPLVKKYYKNFKLEQLDYRREENKCTVFINKTIKEREYKKLDKQLVNKNDTHKVMRNKL